MSEIDSYHHECIGIVLCPSRDEIVRGNNTHRNIPLYLLKEDSFDADSWQAKKGDLLLSGGSGESAALRVSIPEAILFFTHEQKSEPIAEVVHAYWTEREVVVFCDGYARLGWSPQDRIEFWLAEHLVAFVLTEYPELFGKWRGNVPLKRDGSICRLPTLAEKEMW
ncbi:MAG: hypothetical protein HZB51_24375 [Chloroflexi bacterium]|nr:hypothetical protein [Chloroflexota bacterium]